MVEFKKGKKGEVCEVDNCRSNKFRLEDGKYFCKRGHEQIGQVQIDGGEDDFGTQGRKIRKKVEVQEQTSRVFRGSRAFRLFLQAYQVILWKQCYWLVNSKGFPAELETIVRDLWAVRLQSLKSRAEDPFDTDSQTTLFSSQSEEESAGSTEDDSHSRPSISGKKVPKLVETLGLCYLAILLLRLPVSLGAIHSWASREEIVFIRAVRFVPLEMRERLPATYLGALDTRTPLRPGALHEAVSRLIFIYNRESGMNFPPLNHPPLLFKYIECLSIPLDIYHAVTRLARLTSHTFSFKIYPPRDRGNMSPEVQLMSLLVIAIKLSQPFDSVPRNPATSTEASALAIDWDRWYETRQLPEKNEMGRRGLVNGEQIKVNEADVFEMTGTQLDDYMDWYEKMWVDESSETKVSKQLLDLFPIGRRADEATPGNHSLESVGPVAADEHTMEQLKAVQGTLKMRTVISEQNAEAGQSTVCRPGSYYKQYRTPEDLPASAKTFFEAAAGIIGVSLKALVRGVYQTESQLRTWAQKENKSKVAA